MNKMTVIARNKKTYFLKRLMEEVGSHVPVIDPYSEAVVSAQNSLIIFRSFGVYNDDRDLRLVEKLPNRMVNPVRTLKLFRSKSGQYQWFKEQGLPCLKWERLASAAPAWLQDLGEILVKPDMGQGGWGIQVFQSHEFMKWKEEQQIKGDMSWLVQPYIKKAVEWRVFFIQEELFCLRREASNSLVANFAQGGVARFEKLPHEFEALVRSLIQKSQAFYGAIDLLVTSQGPKILELNTVPGIEQLEQVTGLNIMRMFLERLWES